MSKSDTVWGRAQSMHAGERKFAVDATGLPVGLELPEGASLIDARFDNDSCGVGVVASVLGKYSHKILWLRVSSHGTIHPI